MVSTYETEQAERESRRSYRAEFRRWVGGLRDWTYWVTLEYGDPFYGTERVTNNHLFKWAKDCQPHFGGAFEYFLVPEHVEQGRFDHVHGLLFLDGKQSEAKRVLLTSAWRHGYSKVTPIRPGDLGKGPEYLAGYMAKELNTSTPFLFSPSLLHRSG